MYAEKFQLGANKPLAREPSRMSRLPRVAFDVMRLVDGMVVFVTGIAVFVVFVGGVLG